MEYNDIYDFFQNEDNKKSLNVEMLKLEEIFANAREGKEINYELFEDSSIEKPKNYFPSLPIYLTRSRIKSVDSIFLKLKRKTISDITSITDIVGIRVLCLFNQDISIVYRFILDRFLNDSIYNLTKIKIYGWEDTSIFEQILKSYDSNIYKPDKNRYGYRSIHFSGTIKSKDKEPINFEIQLRTLLQDVWGEISHKITYKNKEDYLFVDDSFRLLSRDLETNDLLLDQIKTFTSKQECSESNAVFMLKSVFEYEQDKLPFHFLGGGEFRTRYITYRDLVYQNGIVSNSSELKKAEQKYESLATDYKNHQKTDHLDSKFVYWDNMEKAFYNLASQDLIRLKEAEIYYLSKQDSYVASFRLGQLAIYEDNFVLAMRYFDKCKTMFEVATEENIIKANLNLALIYWNYGKEYFLLSIKAIDDVINKIVCIKDDMVKIIIYNAACWYYIEHYKTNKADDKFLIKAEEYYNKLVELVELVLVNKTHGKIITKNTYDTLAWYNYCRFTLSGNENTDFLKEAKKYLDILKNTNINNHYQKSDKIIHNTHDNIINCDYIKYISNNELNYYKGD